MSRETERIVRRWVTLTAKWVSNASRDINIAGETAAMPDEYLPRPLSDKAKGKQRAVDPVEDERNHLANGSSSRPQEPLSRPLTIRFTEGVHDLVLDVHDKETVKHVKDRVGSLLGGSMS